MCGKLKGIKVLPGNSQENQRISALFEHLFESIVVPTKELKTFDGFFFFENKPGSEFLVGLKIP